ncbi:MAG: cobalt ECF transporter T component CbiQ [Lachnospiraceae bacterium]
MHSIDQYAYHSKLRNWNPVVKCIYSVFCIILCIALKNIPVSLAVFAGNTILITVIGKSPMRGYLKSLRIPATFLLLSTAAILFHISENPMDGFAIPIGSFYITNTRDQLFYGLQLLTTAIASVTGLYALSFTTPMTDVLMALRKMHCPDLLVELMLLIYRFIFLLQETAHQIQISQQSRLSNQTLRTQFKSFGLLGSSLFILAMKRSFAIYDAMESRCFQGTLNVLEESIPLRVQQTAMFAGLGMFYVLTGLAVIYLGI